MAEQPLQDIPTGTLLSLAYQHAAEHGDSLVVELATRLELLDRIVDDAEATHGLDA